MRRIPLALAAVALAACLGGCGLKPLVDTIGAATDLSVPPASVIVAANAFDLLEATAKNIIIACTPAPQPGFCAAVPFTKMDGAVKAGRKARDALEAFMAAHPGALGSRGLYDALTAASSTIQSATAAYQAAQTSGS